MGAFWERHFQIILVFWSIVVGVSLGLKFGETVFELFVLFCASVFAVLAGIFFIGLFEGLKAKWLDIEPEEQTVLKKNVFGVTKEPERNLFLNLFAKWWSLFYVPCWFFLARQFSFSSLDEGVNRILIAVVGGLLVFAIARTGLLFLFRTYGNFVPKVLI